VATPLKRQQLREAEDIERIIAEMRRRSPQRMAALGEEVAKQRLSAAHAAKARLASHRTLATPEQLASVARQLETIIAAETVNPDTGEVSTIEQTKRVVSLVDVMHRDGLLDMVYYRAAERFRELFFEAQGPSAGVGSYGEYTAASEPSSRMPTTDRRMQSFQRFARAAAAAFTTEREDGKDAWDVSLMQEVMPAIVCDRRSITQASIGLALSPYKGQAQKAAAGGMVIYDVLRRLTLHFQFRER
jgi:hypothetical protein